MKSRGLGDTIEKVAKATGIKKMVEGVTKAVGKKDCGCGKRRDTLNRIFPYQVDSSSNSIYNKKQ